MSADFLARAYSTFVAYLAEPAARSLMIGCVAAAALAAFRVKRVGTRLLVWTAVLCAALAMPFLGALLPRVSFAVPASPLLRTLQAKINPAPALKPQREAIPAASTGVAANFSASRAAIASSTVRKFEVPLRDSGGTIAPQAAHREDASHDTALATLSATSSAMPVANVSRSASPAAAIPWTALLLGIYLAGVAILLARLLVGIWFSRKLQRAAQKIDATDSVTREALRLLRFRSCIAGLANAPALKESVLLAVPATLGIRRPVILLPAEWRSWSEEQFDAVLAHEISHVARRDALTQILSLIHRAIFWFNPLAWWLDVQFTDLAEQASDEAALASGADRARYAETLLAFFAQLAASRRRVWWQGLAMAKHHKANGIAERRVTRILAWKGAMSMKKSVAVAVIAFAAPLIFLAASVHPFIAHAQEAPKPPAPPQNVILPGGPVAPALPNAPKGGLKGGVSAPALPPAPQGGVVAPSPMTPPAAGTPVVAPSTMTPPAGATPVAPPALAGPKRMMPTPPPAGAAPPTPYSSYSAYSLLAPLAPPAPQSGAAADSARGQYAAAQLQAAAQAFEKARQASQAARLSVRADQLREALKALAQARQVSDAADSAQLLAAQHALEKARHIMEQNDASQLEEASAAMAEARRDLQEARVAQREAHVTVVNGRYTSYNGPRYVIMSGPNEGVEMSGDDEDFHHAQELRKKLGKDLIWFERDEKSYVITDPDFIAKAKALFAPEDALSKQQDELSRQQDALSQQQDALSEKQDSVKVKVPDISPDLQRIKSELDALRNQDGATQRELGRLQSELGQLQSQVGRFQSDAGVQQSNIGRQQGELGRQQGELGRKQGELGRQQGEIARAASRQLRQMLDDAIAKGIAKPE